jgi:hypothetical protein
MHRLLCALFALLSLIDLALTRWLLGRSRGQVYEVNPIAKWFLDRHGWPGMACFKGAGVLVVMCLYGIIFRYRPRAARGVLTFGCVSLAIVVCYSLILCQRPARMAEQEEAQEHLRLEEWKRQRAAMMALVAELRRDLLAERCTLREAVDRLAAMEQGKIADVLLSQIQPFHDRSVVEGTAAFLISNVVNSLKENRRSASRVGRRLTWEFEMTYGRTIPTALVNMLPDLKATARA